MSYLRLAALGDSSTVGVGDRGPAGSAGWRGWSRLLSEALGSGYDVSYCNVAVTGATAADVRRSQLDDALAHAPDIASLVVGVNETMRSSWDPIRVNDDLHAIAASLSAAGATLLTVLFHDVPAALSAPWPVRRPLERRLGIVNQTYAEIHAEHGGIQIDLASLGPGSVRDLFSVDRLHPSELGHRHLAQAFGHRLRDHGLDFEPTSLLCDGPHEGRFEEVRWLVTEVAPWFGRRARDLGPWAAKTLITR